MGLTYLASPYTHKNKAVERSRYEAACNACYLLISKGRSVYSPICHWHPIVNLGYHVDYDRLLQVDMEILAHCTEILVLCIDGWKESNGVRRELVQAKELGIAAKYCTLKDLIVML